MTTLVITDAEDGSRIDTASWDGEKWVSEEGAADSVLLQLTRLAGGIAGEQLAPLADGWSNGYIIARLLEDPMAAAYIPECSSPSSVHLFTCVSPVCSGDCSTAVRRPRVIKNPKFESLHDRNPDGTFGHGGGAPSAPKKAAKKAAPAKMTPAKARERLDNAVKMFGSDRSKWSPAQRREAEKLDAIAAPEKPAVKKAEPKAPAKKAAAPRKAVVPKPAKPTPAEVAQAFQGVKSGDVTSDQLEPQVKGLTSPQLDALAGELGLEGWKPRATKAAKVAAVMQVARGVEDGNAIMGRNGSGARSGGAIVSGSDISGQLDAAKLRLLLGKKNPKGTREDAAMSAIAKAQGFDGKPTVGSPSDIDTIVKAGGKEVFRLVADSIDPKTGKVTTADKIIEQLRSGHPHFSLGLSGSGIYTGERADALSRYALPGKGSRMVRLALKPGSRTIDTWDAEALWRADVGEEIQEAERVQRKLYEDLQRASSSEEREAAYASYAEARKGFSDRLALFSDLGRWAAAKGYDAMREPRPDGSYWVVLNRTALAMEDRDRKLP